MQYTTAGGSSWTDICTDCSSPYTCSLDTTTLAEGLYDLRAISSDGLGNASTPSTRTNRRIDRTGPTFTTFSISPAGTLSGTATLSGTPTDSGGGVASVPLRGRPGRERARGARPAATPARRTRAPSPPPRLADGSYDFRATATDNNGNATTAPTQTRSVDNPIRGIDVQANNGNNQPGTGDTLTLTFNQPPSVDQHSRRLERHLEGREHPLQRGQRRLQPGHDHRAGRRHHRRPGSDRAQRRLHRRQQRRHLHLPRNDGPERQRAHARPSRAAAPAAAASVNAAGTAGAHNIRLDARLHDQGHRPTTRSTRPR